MTMAPRTRGAPGRRTLRQVLRAGATLAVVLLVGCRGRGVTSEECVRLLDRYAELRLRADDAKVSGADIERARVSTRARARSNLAFNSCTRDVSRESMDCALASFNADEIERCLIPMP